MGNNNKVLKYITTSSKDCGCSVCHKNIKKETPHYRFYYNDGNWRKMFKMCRDCIEKLHNGIRDTDGWIVVEK